MVNDQKFVLKWYDRLQFKIPVVFLLLFAVLVASIVLVMKRVGKARLEEQAYRLVTQTGNTIVADVYSRTVFAESLAKSLANLGEQLPLDVESYMTMVPKVLDINGTESFIAGGGIWPEPYKFSKDIERRSFFWGRDEKEKLQYYNNYNDPNGTGYHNEEWYVPAKYLSKDKNFWSKSYMDPFTYQPMVTCTVPMYRNGEFFGVSTVDFKLEGLGNFLEQASSRLGGYSFVVDRNGKFLSFPKESMVKVYLVDSLGNKTQEFIYVDQMAQTNPLFKPIADGISQVNSKIIKRSAGTDKGKFSEALATSIDSESYQINHQEAEMIAAAITDPLIDMNNNYQMKQFSIDNDVLLSKPCTVFIFHVPQTYWKVITVIPISEAVAISTSIYYTILSFIIGITAAVILAGFLIFYRSFVKPLRLMSKQLRGSVEANANMPEHIKYAEKNELGLLAHWFNLRSDQLADTLASLYAIQNNLEKSIEQRTMELTNANQQLETDITKRKEAEMQLRDSQEKLQLVMDNVPQSIFWKDRNSVYISCNSSFAKDAGLKNMQDITGKTDYDFAWKKEEADFFRQCDAEIMQSDTPRYHIVESVLQANGRQAWVDVNKVPMHDSDNNVIGIIGTYEDITERKLAEEELLKKTALLEAQLNASIDGILVVNENNKKIIVNQQFANLFSVPQSIMDDEDDTSLLKYVVSLTKYPEIVLEKIKYLYDHQNETSRDETELKNGMVLDRYSAPILGKNEKNYGRIWTFRDITARKQAEEEMKKMLQWQQGINTLQQSLLAQASLEDRLKTITDSIVQIFDADFCRIWLIKPGDMCEDCVHAEAKEGPHVCRYRDKCLHLMASSGRYTHTDGKTHRRVPFGCYKIGLVASGVEHKFITNDAQNDPRVHNNEWARELGLTSFAGYQLKAPGGETLGVLAMFAKHTITPAEDVILDGLGSDVAFVVQQSIADSKLRHSEAMFHALYDTTSDAVMMLGDGKFFDCNKATMAIFGCADKDEFYSKHPADFSPLKQPCGTDSMTLANQQIALAMEKGTNHFEWIHKRIDTGKEFPADVLINAMELDGKLVVHTVVRDITERKQKEEQLKEIQDELLDASRRAGMAEVATDVLHNVGNVLNSINVSTTLIGETISKSEIQNLKKVTNMIEEHLQDINTFFAQDPKGRYVPSYLIKTVKLLANEQESVIGKLGSLVEDVNHIKSIVNMHQEYAKVSGVEISTTVDRVIEDAIRINLAGLKRHMIRIVRDYAELGEVSIDKQKVIQILVNLIGNAKYALSNNETTERILTIRSYKYGDSQLGIEVIDNGEGISSENLTKIFQHGFTTKKEGHGFGLHSGALAAKEMKGSLAVHSDGLGHGAMFTLELPFKPVEIIQCTR